MRAVTIATPSPAVSAVLDSRGGQVVRTSFRETTGTASATVDLYDGTGTDGLWVDSIALSPGQSTRDYYLPGQYPYRTGLFLDVVSGSVRGAVTVHHEDPVAMAGATEVVVVGIGPMAAGGAP